jgi:glucose-6-phosphate-specific signal transduction histidine kinase
MNLFKTFSLKWWQSGIFKVGMLCVGIAVGAYLHDVFANFLLVIVAVAVVCLAFITYVWGKQ